MNVDIQRITYVIWYSNIIFMLPIQVTPAIYILYKNLGIGSLSGIADGHDHAVQPAYY